MLQHFMKIVQMGEACHFAPSNMHSIINFMHAHMLTNFNGHMNILLIKVFSSTAADTQRP